MQQIYRRTNMSKCEFNKVASNFIVVTIWHERSAVSLQHFFITLSGFPLSPVAYYMFKVNKRNTRTRCETC